MASNRMGLPKDAPCALVVGLCSHGLAVTRSLRKQGVEVHALEANPGIPGALTNSAQIHLVASIKHDSLIDDLLAFRTRIPAHRRIILFPTNDNNVRVIAKHIDRLSGGFVVSWGDSADTVQRYLQKNNIEQRCRDVGLNYPASVVLQQKDDLLLKAGELRPPFIIKPSNPQSGFKAIKCTSIPELETVVESYPQDYPFLVQEWVSGTDKDLFFCALYLDQGSILTRFVGNKLESYPPALGQTTVAITADEPETEVLTEKFFDGLKMSGPVSMEFKRDSDGNFWVIEPTVGRTDFWVGLCIRGGCDLPFIEYVQAAGLEYSTVRDKTLPAIWFDSERDVLAPVKYLAQFAPGLSTQRLPTFSFFSYEDLRPFIRSSFKAQARVTKSVANRLRGRTKVLEPILVVTGYNRLEQLPQGFQDLLALKEQETIFLGHDWFANFCSTVASDPNSVQFFCLEDAEGNALAMLPMWRSNATFHGVKVRKLTGLSNYYSPIFDVILDRKRISREQAYAQFISYIWKNVKNWDLIDIHPITAESRDDLLKNMRLKFIAFDYYITQNYYHQRCESYKSYLADRPSRIVNTLKRKSKKLKTAEGYSIAVYSSPKEIESKLKDYHRIYSKSWKIDEPYPDFINGLANMCASRGLLRLGFLEVADVIVAVQFWIVANDTAYIYKLAYDKNYSKYSPGTILTASMIEKSIEIDKVNKIDFLTGQDAFKKDWMELKRNLYGVQVVNYRTLSGVAVLIINELSKIKSHMLLMKNWLIK
ncbi:MAG: GNAT family N-acetyltransferase [Motiliproteus sp.]